MAGLADFANDDNMLKKPGLESPGGGSTNKELMESARISLSGSWGSAVLGYVLYLVLAISFSFFMVGSIFFVAMIAGLNGANVEAASDVMGFFANVVQFLVSGPLMVGFAAFFLGIAQNADAQYENLFLGFRRFWKSFATYFLYGLFIYLWMLLLIIPGIIATFRYAMAFFIIADDEECGPLEAISRSKEMMKGNKWKLFCLHWRFFGWGLLCLLLPIGFLWLVPYMQTSFAKFYEDVK